MRFNKQSYLIFFIASFLFLANVNFVNAQAGGVVTDIETEYNTGLAAKTAAKAAAEAAKAAETAKIQAAEAAEKLKAKQLADELKAKAEKTLWHTLATALNATLRSTVNTLAFDAATWLGTGLQGQKPQWFTESPEKNWANAGDMMAGYFMDSLNKSWGVDLCKPTLEAKIVISLGLTQYVRPTTPDCTASQMVQNWEEALKPENSKDFLKKFAGYFSFNNNDLGISLTTQSSLLSQSLKAKAAAVTKYDSQGRWKDVTNLGGLIDGIPNQGERTAEMINNLQTGNMFQYTGNLAADATNVFTNQLAITYLQTQLRKISSWLNKTDNETTSITSADFASQGPGVNGTKDLLSKILEPDFSTKTDYNILSLLVSCDPSAVNGYGPTDCIISEPFRQAIEKQERLADALKYIGGDKPFAFKPSNQSVLEVTDPTEGIPYRSLAILRKYRIIPVGWELAADYLKNHPEVINMNSLNALTTCFSQPGKWCTGMVDPNWVLKAPAERCIKTGFGSEILSKASISQGNDSSGNALLSKISISRSNDYCADEQSCIQENSDGTCNYYGYCTEERRTWKFDNGTSCDPVFNTCESFTNSTDNTQVSYLKNTLQYCSGDQAGCEKYTIAPTYQGYNASSTKILWDKSTSAIYFNSGVQTCEADNEGCHELLRIKTGLSSNLITVDSSFEKDSTNDIVDNGLLDGWPVSGPASIVNNAPDNSGNAIYINYDSTTTENYGIGIHSYDYSNQAVWEAGNSVLPKGFVMEPETSYTLSADVYLVSGDKVTLDIGSNNNYWEKKDVTEKGSWQHVSVTLLNNADVLANEFRIYGYTFTSGVPIQFYVDNVKFEIGNNKTPAYSPYRDSNNLIYEKLLPAYLESTCYKDAGTNYTLKSGAPTICSVFARKCNRDEAGCEMYTSANDNTSIPASVVDKDYCSAECDGYDTYIQKENNFSSSQLAYFIPKTATTCSSSEVGCQEFTNLDKASAGGEDKQFYSYLRACVKPTDNGANCSDFYSWEGSASSGKQLVKYSLQASSTNGVLSPSLVASQDDSTCNSDIYNLPITDPSYNSDCRQFYSKDGGVYYRLYSKTISCSDSCYSYRLTEKNIVKNITDSSNCSANGYNWDSVNNYCVYCKDGGAWNESDKACIYKAIPSASISCSAKSNGCSEYNGNQGSNTKTILTSDFENGVGEWKGGEISSDSLYAGGKSLYVDYNINYPIGNLVKKGSAYVLSFLAKASSADTNLLVFIGNSKGAHSYFSVAGDDYTSGINIKAGEWRLYKINLKNIDRDIDASEPLTFYASGILIDNIKLTEISDSYYLIKNSWNTPTSCDQDENGNPFPLFMLGCSQYSDRAGAINYLHNFNRLCQESAVGCEAMIDTANTDSPLADSVSNNGVDYKTSADNLIYAVYDSNKLCSSGEKGCERLAKTTSYEGKDSFSEVFLKNNPDSYASILCGADGVGCKEWTTSTGTIDFKDPGDMVCEWRSSQKTGVKGWFKKPVKRCNGVLNGQSCQTDSDCSSNQSCLLESGDNPCPTEGLKTIGQGGPGNEIVQPKTSSSESWVGTCLSDQSTCTEYIDPVSDFSTNLVDNHYDHWIKLSDTSYDINVYLEGNNLYTLTAGNSSIKLFNQSDSQTKASAGEFYELGADNKLSTSPVLELDVAPFSSKVFYLDQSINGSVYFFGSAFDDKISLKKTVVSYQLSKDVDKTTCTGPDATIGCLYFNERSVTGVDSFNPLTTYNAWDAYNKTINSTSKDANALIKVEPDRVCNKWLACKSYANNNNNTTDNNVCLSVGTCDRFGEKGSCANFPPASSSEKKLASDNSNIADFSNLSGYSKVFGYFNNNSNNAISWLYDIGSTATKQVGGSLIVPNNSFEIGSGSSISGWSGISGTTILSSSDSQIVRGVGTEKVSLMPDGNNALLKGKTDITSDLISVTPGDYVASAYINTKYVATPESKSSCPNGNVLFAVTGEDKNVWGISGASFWQEPNQDWTLQKIKFTVPVGINNIRIRLGGDCVSGAYFDDIQIKPALKIDDSDYLAQTCRLFPAEDSLSCDYRDGDSNVYKKGLFGYCLEYDKAPGNPNTCLLWYPGDKIQGDKLEEGAGYAGKAPLYYCTKSLEKIPFTYDIGSDDASVLLINGKNVFSSAGWNCSLNKGTTYLKSGKNTIVLFAQDWGGNYFLRYTMKSADGRIQVSTSDISDWQCTVLDQKGPFIDSLGNTLVDANTKLRKYYFNQDNAGYSQFTNYEPDADDYRKSFWDEGSTSRSYQYDLKNSGTVAISGTTYSSGSKTIAGDSNAKFTTELSVGDSITLSSAPTVYAKVIAISSDVSLTVDSPLGNGTTQSIKKLQPSTVWQSPVSHDAGNCGTSDTIWARNIDGTDASGGKQILCRRVIDVQPSCESFVEVVDSDGNNMAYQTRVSSQYSGAECQTTPDLFAPAYCTIGNQNNPYNSIKYPTPADDPTQWDGSTEDGKQPISYSTNASDANMGNVFTKNELSTLFAKSYGGWIWDQDESSYVENTTTSDWQFDNSANGVAPKISNIKFNNFNTATVNGDGFVNLTFNSQINPDQMPLTEYRVDWGDGEETVVDGNMISRSTISNTHSLTHAFNYYDLKNKKNNDPSKYPMLSCDNDNTKCTISPKISLKDNWGWCTEGYLGAPCPLGSNVPECIDNNNIAGGVLLPADQKNDNACEARFSTYPYLADGYYQTSSNSITIYRQQ